MMTITVELPMETGELVEKALDKARDSQHHKLVHEGGFTIERDYQNHWFFKRPDGRAVAACGYHAQDTIDDGEFSELFNNPPAGGLLIGVKSFVSEPPPPAYWH